MTEAKNVFKLINEVHKEVVKVGISKDMVNQQQRFNYRGIDQLYNTISALLAKNGLMIMPRVLERSSIERPTAKGGAMTVTTLKVDFDFISSNDGSIYTITNFGEAMDSADKSTNKALTAAYKYALFTAFCIPLSGQDPDETTPEDLVPRLQQGTPAWERAKASYQKEGNLDKVKKFMSILPEDEMELVSQCMNS